MLYSEYLLLKVLLIMITIYEGPFVFSFFFSMKKPYVGLFFFLGYFFSFFSNKKIGKDLEIFFSENLTKILLFGGK